MPRLLERHDGTVIEVSTREEQADLDARYAASKNARRSWELQGKPLTFAAAPPFGVARFVQRMADKLRGSPDLLEEFCEVSREFGMTMDGPWPHARK